LIVERFNNEYFRPWVQDILSRNPDPNANPEFLKNFKAKLKEPVDLEQKIGETLKCIAKC